MSAKVAFVSIGVWLALCVAIAPAEGRGRGAHSHVIDTFAMECVEVTPPTPPLQTESIWGAPLLKLPRRLRQVPTPRVSFQPTAYTPQIVVPLRVEILDPAGAVIPGTQIVLRTGSTEMQRGETNARGLVLLGECRIGSQVTAEAAGFQTLQITLTSCIDSAVTITLQLGHC